ncbi:MAG: divalent-cation tolerance protein CutA [Candidatus Kariarchaeaceae archaeon]|jgi:periplasmic divalent cation tolerance protein
MQIGVTITTVGKIEDAKKISRDLIEQKLIACGQISVIESIYLWEAKIHEEQEYQITMKHPSGTIELLQETIKGIHPYDTPEIISYKVTTSQEYGEWCIQSCE